ncbi:Complex i intermediate-associated protein 84 protein [Lasiodiplodia theobromae]|uniref:Complex i intermediate-associated protein 84 protein n=1 Tax=Lasiodiplodia theobromae TaxID=45133 RepID=UPI0015C3FB9F|nr:Complex i intermediate-associated protein 84 protein [Lasiodiplodia theobromae]KAF4536220.1 Complex i intermediate-associated protein 84 protein [Lasiodiplodia theobromae]
MPAHLTRLVIRRILSNEPIVYRDCLYRRANACLQPRAQRIRRNGFAQTRSFFGMAREPERKVKGIDLAPGLDTLIELNRAQTGQSRPPDLEMLCKALDKLFRKKYFSSETMSDVEAGHALNTLRYLNENRPKEEDVLNRKDSPRSDAHLALTEEVFKFLDAMRPDGCEPDSYNGKMIRSLAETLEIMSHYEPVRARDLLVEKYKTNRWTSQSQKLLARPWASVLQGLYQKGNHAEAQKTLEMMQELEIPTNIMMQVKETLLGVHAALGDLENTKRIYNDLSQGPSQTVEIDSGSCKAVLQCCLQHGDSKWAQSIVRSMLETLEVYYLEPADDRLDEVKKLWDVLFFWAAASGKGVDEVDRMMNVMVRRTFADGRSAQPDVETINELVSWCMSRNQLYFAERYISLGAKWGIHPNALTYYLQVKYRLSGGDIDGARAAYRQLQAVECSKEKEDIRAANELIQAMCASQKYTFSSIMALADDLTERKGRFEPETVSALSVLHLRRNELHDVIDLLQTHAFHFSEAERRKIADSLVAMVLDRAHTSTARAWDTYIIAQSIFAELPRSARTQIMREFFDRGRADMACHVFTHMRELDHPDTRATADTYVVALTGIAEFAAARVAATDNIDVDADAADAEAEYDDDESRAHECRSLLDAVHNAMKLDLDLEPSTRLRNALMLAYTAAGQPARAWSFWEDIVNSREGPSFNSIPIAFRACERMPVDGERHARALWARLRKVDVEITKPILAAYVGALAGNQNTDAAKEVLLKCERDFGLRPDTFILGTLFNAAYGVSRQGDLERWIQAKFPTQWVELKRLGARKMDDGPRLFNIDRRLTP